METITDGVVFLNAFTVADAPTLLTADQDNQHRRWFEIPDDFVPSLRHSKNVILRWNEDGRLGASFTYAVRNVSSSSLVGGCEIRPRGNDTANLSYWTYPAYRRRGIATRAVSLARQIAAGLCITQLEVLIHVENIASRTIAITNGFTGAGVQNGHLYFVCNPKEQFGDVRQS